MRKHLIRWWYTPAWRQEQRLRSMAEWDAAESLARRCGLAIRYNPTMACVEMVVRETLVFRYDDTGAELPNELRNTQS